MQVEIKLASDQITTQTETVYGYPAAFGIPLNSTATPSLAIVVSNPADACEDLEPVSTSTMATLLVQRGNCSFVEKASKAQAAGYTAMIVYDALSDDCIFMGKGENDTVELLAVSATAAAAEKLIDLASQGGSVTLRQPELSEFDVSELILWVLAVGSVAIGSLWSGHGALHGSGGSSGAGQSAEEAAEEDHGVISLRAASTFILVASAVLLAMFFLLSKWLVVLLTCLFAFIAWQSAIVTLFTGLFLLSSPTLKRCSIKLPWKSHQSSLLISLAEILATTGTALWLYLAFTNSHWAWTLQDPLCLCLVLFFLRAIKLPNLKIGAILLLSALIYDVWWVFLQPIFIGGPSVMVEVATGGGAGFRMPIVFAVPRFNGLGTNPSLSMLGLGDIVLPGLLVAMSRRWELSGGNHYSYFLPMVVSYALGLIITFVALLVGFGGDQGQPALLYLVPCTLGTISVLGWKRGELQGLWNWQEHGERNVGAGEDVEQGAGEGERSDNGDDEAAPLLS